MLQHEPLLCSQVRCYINQSLLIYNAEQNTNLISSPVTMVTTCEPVAKTKTKQKKGGGKSMAAVVV